MGNIGRKKNLYKITKLQSSRKRSEKQRSAEHIGTHHMKPSKVELADRLICVLSGKNHISRIR